MTFSFFVIRFDIKGGLISDQERTYTRVGVSARVLARNAQVLEVQVLASMRRSLNRG
jgi:hypothetical protein